MRIHSLLWLTLSLLQVAAQATESVGDRPLLIDKSTSNKHKKLTLKQRGKMKSATPNSLDMPPETNGLLEHIEPIHPNKNDLDRVIQEALRFQGVPYRPGGRSPQNGFDCSGYVNFVFLQVGQKLPSTSNEMAKLGDLIKFNNLRPGDLVFFNTLRRPYSHVGIYLGNQNFIHAPSKGSKVRIDKLNSRYWSNHFQMARRLHYRDPR